MAPLRGALALAHTLAARAGVIKTYEGRLRELNPGVTNISYDISDLFAYIDSLPDLAALVCVRARAAHL